MLQREKALGAAEKSLRLRVAPSRLFVRSDPLLLERILINLAANAVHYTPRGGILIGCRRRGKRARIEVWDTGIGMAPEQQQTIFQEFYQVANPQRDRGKGLGLGLAIAARLAGLLGCRIELASRPGKGSVFALEVQRGRQPVTPEYAVPAASASDSLQGLLVLVVDDDPLVRDAMGSLLTHWGCEVAVAADGEEAFVALGSAGRSPGVLLCDYRLPGGETGIQVVERLRAAARMQIPAARISGDTTPESLRAAKAGGYPVVPKPVAPAKLRALVEHLASTSPARWGYPLDDVQDSVG